MISMDPAVRPGTDRSCGGSRGRPAAGCLGSLLDSVEGAGVSEGRPQSDDFRIEHDSMGEVRVPAEAKWRAQTQRAVENFPISGRPIERELIGALASIKGASASVRATNGTIDADLARAVHDAAAEVARGDWDGEFPIDVF